MALNALQLNTLSRMFQLAKVLTDTYKPQADSIDYLVNGAPKLLAGVSQADLDAVSSFSGLTVQQMNDLAAALTGAIRIDVGNAYTQLLNGTVRA